MWKTVEKPSTSFSNSGFTASGVTSRPVKPVPPVVMTTSTAGSSIQPCTLALISGTSSLTRARAAHPCPPLPSIVVVAGKRHPHRKDRHAQLSAAMHLAGDARIVEEDRHERSRVVE